MIVPQYWAEGRVQHRRTGRQVTVRRFGWSDVSEHEAQAMADERARAALETILAGGDLPRREPKVPYNGAAGVPIREEIIERRGEAILTRNRYGALCLNTPGVMFVDIDWQEPATSLRVLTWVLILGAGAGGYLARSWLMVFAILAFGFLIVFPLMQWALQRWGPGVKETQRRTWERIATFFKERPELSGILYETPAGLRLVMTHDRVDPTAESTREWFGQLGADPQFARMCQRQGCFRARVSPKPWRIGMKTPLKPRPGVWPVSPERLPERARWVAGYEEKARGFASCRFLERFGDGPVHPGVEPVLRWHDTLSRAHEGLPIA